MDLGWFSFFCNYANMYLFYRAYDSAATMKNGLLGPPSSAIGIPDCGHAAQTTTMPHHEQQPDRPGVGDHHLTGLRRQNVGVSTKPPAPIYQTKTADGEFLVQLSTCHRIWLWARQLRWMNSRAMPGKAYNPTEVSPTL